MTKEQYLEAIADYNKYSASVAQVLGELYKTSMIDLHTTLTQRELSQRLNLSYALVSKNITILGQGGFLTGTSETGQFKTYILSQEKLNHLLKVYKAKHGE